MLHIFCEARCLCNKMPCFYYIKTNTMAALLQLHNKTLTHGCKNAFLLQSCCILLCKMLTRMALRAIDLRSHRLTDDGRRPWCLWHNLCFAKHASFGRWPVGRSLPLFSRNAIIKQNRHNIFYLQRTL